MFRIFRGTYTFKSSLSLDNSIDNNNSIFKEYYIEISKVHTLSFIMSVPVALLLGLLDNTLLPSILTYNDKILHFSVFTIETIMFLNCFKTLKVLMKISNLPIIKIDHLFLFFSCCIVIGSIGSEFFQHFINPNRSFDYYDMLCNCLGSTLGYVIRKYTQRQ